MILDIIIVILAVMILINQWMTPWARNLDEISVRMRTTENDLGKLEKELCSFRDEIMTTLRRRCAKDSEIDNLITKRLESTIEELKNKHVT